MLERVVIGDAVIVVIVLFRDDTNSTAITRAASAVRFYADQRTIPACVACAVTLDYVTGICGMRALWCCSRDDGDEKFSHGRSLDYHDGFRAPYIHGNSSEPEVNAAPVNSAISGSNQNPQGTAANMAVPQGVWMSNPSMYTGPPHPANYGSLPPPNYQPHGPYYGPGPLPDFGTLPGPQFVQPGPQFMPPGPPPAHFRTNSANASLQRTPRSSKHNKHVNQSPSGQGQGQSSRSNLSPRDQQNG